VCTHEKEATVACWGHNRFGMLVNRSGEVSTRPVTVSGLTSVVALAARSLHTCAVRIDGTVYCWGHNRFGRFGNGGRNDSDQQVKNISSAVSVGGGGAFSCALLQNKQIWCWGSNAIGQLGNGTRKDSLTPVLVNYFSEPTREVAIGYDFVCALQGDKTVVCWGMNFSGNRRSGLVDEPIEIK
jgi:alpha-tubulin suppressor-like RCC1 family protein